MGADAYAFMVFTHILLLVFWLGTDVGVFLAAKLSERSELSVETRATVLKLGMTLDRLPRSALVLIMPSGLTLASGIGALSLPAGALAAVWVVALIWLAVLWAGFLRPETPIEKRALVFNFAMNALLAVVVTAYAIWLLTADGAPGWLALKVLAVGLIFIAGVVLDVLFKPAVEAFQRILADGASPERDAAYSKALAPVYRAVLSIYALVLIATWLGVTR